MNGTLERLSEIRAKIAAENDAWDALLAREPADLLLSAAMRLEPHRRTGEYDRGDHRAQLLLESLREVFWYV